MTLIQTVDQISFVTLLITGKYPNTDLRQSDHLKYKNTIVGFLILHNSLTYSFSEMPSYNVLMHLGQPNTPEHTATDLYSGLIYQYLVLQ